MRVHDRPARRTTVLVGGHVRSIAEVASDLGCDGHTVMEDVALYGTPLMDDPIRFGTVNGPYLDETLLCRQGRLRVQCWSNLTA